MWSCMPVFVQVFSTGFNTQLTRNIDSPLSLIIIIMFYEWVYIILVDYS